MLVVLQVILALLGLWLITGTLLNFSKHPHWYIRGWDFPRVFTAALAAAVLLIYALFFHGRWWDWGMLAGLGFVIARQLYMIYPYMPIAPKRVKQSTRPAGDHRFRLMMSNVLQDNEEHERWLTVFRGSNPDVIVAVEVDARWDAVLHQALGEDYPHHVRQAQANFYGMVLYSRLPFEERPKVRFIVQDDVPSIHAIIRLRDGQRVYLHAMHPRPPEPIRNQDSAPRDAELVLIGKEIAAEQRHIPTIVCGDLNDVAWSYTTQLFLRISKLLDPRMGRGMFNSYNAKSRIFRFPLDHVFHSNEFKLIDLRVCEPVGSDHFPMLIELSCEPEAAAEQKETQSSAEDREDAEEIVHEQAEREQDGKEQGHVSQGAGRG
ncbi:MAG TPA: endonuclease/exonuclease/phosphatase family protein [Tepidisphaeraceae bacterium]|nr:endonuclease/exonuclease/phosphatase family protein [Tepidisphaeraceae bacterium]